jgi:hypothetical protein
MRKHLGALLFLCLASVFRPSSAPASVPPLPIEFGKEVQRLQNLVDQQYGPGTIDVTKDFVGAHPGDIDPWFWVGNQNSALQIKLLKRGAHSQIGWYLEGGALPQIPSDGGLLFSDEMPVGRVVGLTLGSSSSRFGFYIGVKNHRHSQWVTVPGSIGLRRFYTDRKFSDCGPYGLGAVHAPFDGDIQALVFDVSPWTGPNTWLVCFEDRDTGGPLIEDQDAEADETDDIDDERRQGSDNGFDDVIFEVHADGATNARSLSFGALKLIYR